MALDVIRLLTSALMDDSLGNNSKFKPVILHPVTSVRKVGSFLLWLVDAENLCSRKSCRWIDDVLQSMYWP